MKLIQGGCSNGLQFTACQRRLQHVAGIHGALRSSRADHCMKFIDHHDDFTLRALDFLDHGLEALLELAAEPGAGDHRTEVQRHYALAGEDFGYIVRRNLLRQAFYNRGLSHARFTDQARGCSSCAWIESGSAAGSHYRAR